RHEVPEIRERVIEIARDRRVLIVAIVRVEQIQLIVLRGPMGDLATVNRDWQRSSPGCRHGGHDEARYLVRDSRPAGSVLDELLQIEPAVEGNLDGVAD